MTPKNHRSLNCLVNTERCQMKRHLNEAFTAMEHTAVYEITKISLSPDHWFLIQFPSPKHNTSSIYIVELFFVPPPPTTIKIKLYDILHLIHTTTRYNILLRNVFFIWNINGSYTQNAGVFKATIECELNVCWWWKDIINNYRKRIIFLWFHLQDSWNGNFNLISITFAWGMTSFVHSSKLHSFVISII